MKPACLKCGMSYLYVCRGCRRCQWCCTCKNPTVGDLVHFESKEGAIIRGEQIREHNK